MATERLSMRQTREILRQKWSLRRTHREVAQSLGISSGAVGTTVLRARAAGLAWVQVEALSDEALHARVYGPPTPPTRHRPVPDGAYLHAERRKPGVTLELHLSLAAREPIDHQLSHVRARSPGWTKLRPPGEEHQDRRSGDLIDDETEQLERRGIDPVQVFDDEEQWFAGRHGQQELQDRFQRLLLLPLRGEIQGRVVFRYGYRQEGSPE